ncbi:MAG: hypothetical protein E6J60_07460 [Deltaproteobacteria bacterium]|nr:MAG: hypothetical protein E6J60_07460 [Deltaproteobacteria bacterium]
MSEHRAKLAVLGAILLALAPRAARATQKFGPVQLSGNLQTANIVRTPDQNTYEYIMNRNTAHVRLDYDWLQSGKFYNKYDIPFLESSHLSIVWRGVYDSIYDTTPGFIQKEDIHGRAYPGPNGSLVDVFDYAKLKGGAGFARSALTVSGLSRRDRDALKFDNQLREAYADIKLRNIPLSVRAGRQQIVWGETDNFRMLDRANSLDLTWHFQQEIPPPAYGWDEIRRPFWMLKFLYDVGDVWKLSQNFLEWYWNPGDWYPAKQAFLPRPWGLPILNPLTNPVDGAFIGGVCASSPFQITTGTTRGIHSTTARSACATTDSRPWASSSRWSTSTSASAATTAPTTPRSRACRTPPRTAPLPPACCGRASSRQSSTHPTSTRSAPRPTTPTKPSPRPSSGRRRSSTRASRSSIWRRRPPSTTRRCRASRRRTCGRA